MASGQVALSWSRLVLSQHRHDALVLVLAVCSGVAVTPDMKTIIAAGSDRKIKEMEDNWVRGFVQATCARASALFEFKCMPGHGWCAAIVRKELQACS